MKTTREESKRVEYLVQLIRLTRETWCEIQPNESLKAPNSYKDKPDINIVIDALEFFLADEEFELNSTFEEVSKKNDKTD